MTKKITLFAATALLATVPFIVSAATLTRQLDVGVSGADVSALQSFLSLDASLYPSGLVTGYFGSLTKAAIERFQTRNNIISNGTAATTGYGRVGPLTIAALNAQMNSGSVGDVYAPSISNLFIQRGSNNAVITWTGNEASVGKVHYQTSFPEMTEGSATSQAYVGGAVVSETSYSTSHSVTLSGLQPGTTYYYVVESVDSSGNQTIVWPTTLQTTN